MTSAYMLQLISQGDTEQIIIGLQEFHKIYKSNKLLLKISSFKEDYQKYINSDNEEDRLIKINKLNEKLHKFILENIKEDKYLPYSDWVLLLKKYYYENDLFSKISLPMNLGNYKGLEMSSYYIDINYKEKYDSKNIHNAYITEKQSVIEKLKEFRLSQFLNKSTAHQTISERIITHNSKVIIIGNPGIGKSTYAKWLCYSWAAGKVNFNKIPLYINLREIPSTKNDNNLKNYINNIYFNYIYNNLSNVEVIDFDEIANQNILFILDGYDELSNLQKNQLWIYFDTISSSNSSYLLLSRPYGLIGEYNIQRDIMAELIGFNDTQRLHYIQNILGNNKNVTDLINIIDDNIVLKDFSYIPLMLSNISLIYKIENNNYDSEYISELRNVNTSFHLQRLFFKWIEIHSKKVYSDYLMIDIFENEELLKFVANIEISKQFIYEGEGDTSSKPFLAQLCQLGVASIREESVINYFPKWWFHFNHISYQEFLAAKFFGSYITSEAFIYLLQDKSLLNLCRIIFGYLEYQNNEKSKILISKIMKTLEINFLENSYLQNYINYFNILSELSSFYIESFLTEERIILLITVLKFSFYKPEQYTIVTESLIKIYYKSEENNKIIFQESLFNVIEKELFESEQNYDFYYFYDIIENLFLYKSKNVIDSIIKIELKLKIELNKNLNDLKFDKYLTVYYQLLKILSKSLFSHLKYNKKNLLYLHKDNTFFPELILQLIGLASNKITVENIFDISYQQFISFPSEENLLALLSKAQEMVGAFKTESQFDKRDVIAQKLIHMINPIEKFVVENLSFEDIELYIDCTIELLSYFEHSIIYEKIFYISEKYDIDLVLNDSLNYPNIFIEHLSNLMINIKQDKLNYIQNINLLIKSANASLTGRFFISQHRSEIGEMLIELLSLYGNNLSEGYLKYGEENFIIETDNILSNSHKTQLIATLLLDVLSFEYDRKCLIDIFLSNNHLMKMPYVKNYYLPKLFKNVSFFKENYWNYIYDLVNQHYLFKVYYILNNENLFNFAENAQPISNIWDTFEQIINSDFFSEEALAANTALLLQVNYYLLKSIYINKNYWSHDERENLIYNINSIIRNKIILKSFNTNTMIIESMENSSEGIYILMSFILKDTKIKNNRYFYYKINKIGVSRKAILLEEMYKLYTPSIIKNWVSEKLYNDFNSFYIDKKILSSEIKVSEFYSLLPSLPS